MSDTKPLINPNLLNNQYGLTIRDFERFWAGVEHKSNGCAVYKDKVFRIPRSITSEEVRIKPGVVSWIYHFESVANGSRIKTNCSNANCVNPHHLVRTKGKTAKPTVKGFSQNRGDKPHGAEKVRVGNQMIPKFYLTAEWKQLRKDVVTRDGGVCQYCGNKGSQADHVTPRYAGGLDVLQNLVCCCADCNKIAGGRVFETFEKKRSWILKQKK